MSASRNAVDAAYEQRGERPRACASVISVGQAPRGCRLAGALYCRFLRSDLHPTSDEKTQHRGEKWGLDCPESAS